MATSYPRYVWFVVREADVTNANAAAAQLTGSKADLATFVARYSADGSGPGTWRIAGAAFEEAAYQMFKAAYAANFPGDLYYTTNGLAGGTLQETNSAKVKVGRRFGLTEVLQDTGLQAVVS